MAGLPDGPSIPPVVARQRTGILLALLGLATAGWLVFLHRAREPARMGMSHSGPALTMGQSWPLFLAMWVAMMVAMMFPAAAPMVLMYARMRHQARASTALFTGCYIVLWFIFGAGAYLLSAGVDAAAAHSAWVTSNWGRVGGGLLVLAGVYQLTPLKDACLRQCRSPLAFMMTRWRDGRRGAMRLGFVHGLYCMGCCWMLFLILIPLGVMNVAATVAIAGLVFTEKVIPHGRGVGIVAAAALIGYGAAIATHPALLPTAA